MIKRKNNRTLTILLVGIIILLGVLSYLNFRDYKLLKTAFDGEKNDLVAELDKVLSYYDDAVFAKVSLSKKIIQKKEEILNLKDSVSNLEEKNYKYIRIYRSRIFKLEEENRILFQKLDSANTENINLREENKSIKYRLRKQSYFSIELSHKKDSLEKSKRDLENKISVLKKLEISNLDIIPLKRKRKGYTSTSRHSKTEAIKITYDLLFNPLAKSGSRKVHVQLFDDKKNIVLSSDDKTFLKNGRLTNNFSDVFTVNYTEATSNIINIMEFNKGVLSKGTYELVLFMEGKFVGKKRIFLK